MSNRYRKMKKIHTKEQLKKAKTEYISNIITFVFTVLLMVVLISLAIIEDNEKVKIAPDSEYKEFVFIDYKVNRRRKGGVSNYKVYVEGEEEPLYLDDFVTNATELKTIRSGEKIKCRVIKKSDGSAYSYEVFHLETDKKVFFTVDDYIEMSTESTNKIVILSCVVTALVIIFGFFSCRKSKGKYLEIKEALKEE